MRESTRHASQLRSKLPKRHQKEAKKKEEHIQVYNIDDYENLLRRDLGGCEISHLQLAPGKFINSIAKGAGYFLDKVSDITAGPFPTTNNASKMNPYILPLQQQVNSVGNPNAVSLQTPDMIRAQNAQLTLGPSTQQEMPNVMVSQVLPNQIPDAMAIPMPVPMQAGGTYVTPTGTQESNRAQEVSQNINEMLEKSYVTARLPGRVAKNVRYEYVAGVIVIIMVVCFFVGGCIYRIRQKKKKSSKRVH